MCPTAYGGVWYARLAEVEDSQLFDGGVHPQGGIRMRSARLAMLRRPMSLTGVNP